MGFDANQMREALPKYIQKKCFNGEGGSRIAGMGCIAIRTHNELLICWLQFITRQKSCYSGGVY